MHMKAQICRIPKHNISITYAYRPALNIFHMVNFFLLRRFGSGKIEIKGRNFGGNLIWWMTEKVISEGI